MRLGRWPVAVALGLCLLAAACWTLAPAAERSRPNIVLIVVEDLSPRIGAFGDPVARTPNLDRLAREGVRYTSVFTAAGVCAPSRAALITGMHQASIGAQHMRTSSYVWPDGQRKGYETVPPPEVKAFPELMRAAGYFAINNAKTDYQFGNPFTVWDESGGKADWAHRPAGKPFFAMYSLQDTHESALFEPGGGPDDLYGNTNQVEPRRRMLAQRTRPEDVIVPPYYPDTATVRRDIARQYDNVQLMDAWVGAKMEELRKAGVLDNTIVIWTTDHGDGLPRAKRSLYDSGLHVPMIVRYPDGRGAGTTDDRLISFVDLAPTLLAVAGVKAPTSMPGRSFMADAPRNQFIFAARDRFDEVYFDRARAVRSMRFKLIRNYLPDVPFYGNIPYRDNINTMREMRQLNAQGKLSPLQASYFSTPRPAVEFFDLAADPDEINNLANDARYAGPRRELEQALQRWQAAVPDLSSKSEREMVEAMWPGGVQPETAAPVVRVTNGLAELRSATPGASIGYRVDGGADGRWELYVRPVPVTPGQRIEAKAIRYGYKESVVTSAP